METERTLIIMSTKDRKPVETSRRISISDCASVVRYFLRDCSNRVISSVSKQGVSFVISQDSCSRFTGTDQCDCVGAFCESEGSMSRCTVGQGSNAFSTFRRSVCMEGGEENYFVGRANVIDQIVH